MKDLHILAAIVGGMLFFNLVGKIIWDWLKLRKNGNGKVNEDLLISSLTNLNQSLLALNNTLKQLNEAVVIMKDIITERDIDGNYRIYGDPEVKRILHKVLSEVKK